MSSVIVPQDMLEQEWEADDEVLENLANNGDRPSAIRWVDVIFRGDPAALDALAETLLDDGWQVAETEEDTDGEWTMEARRRQSAERAAIHDLTRTCLGFAIAHGVEYDGWGTVATDEDEA